MCNILFEPIMHYWTVDVCTPSWKDKAYIPRCTWKFECEITINPSDYVHSIWKRYAIPLGNDRYVHDRSSQYYLFNNYTNLEDKKMYDNLKLERLLPKCF